MSDKIKEECELCGNFKKEENEVFEIVESHAIPRFVCQDIKKNNILERLQVNVSQNYVQDTFKCHFLCNQCDGVLFAGFEDEFSRKIYRINKKEDFCDLIEYDFDIYNFCGSLIWRECKMKIFAMEDSIKKMEAELNKILKHEKYFARINFLKNSINKFKNDVFFIKKGLEKYSDEIEGLGCYLLGESASLKEEISIYLFPTNEIFKSKFNFRLKNYWFDQCISSGMFNFFFSIKLDVFVYIMIPGFIIVGSFNEVDLWPSEFRLKKQGGFLRQKSYNKFPDSFFDLFNNSIGPGFSDSLSAKISPSKKENLLKKEDDILESDGFESLQKDGFCFNDLVSRGKA